MRCRDPVHRVALDHDGCAAALGDDDLVGNFRELTPLLFTALGGRSGFLMTSTVVAAGATAAILAYAYCERRRRTDEAYCERRRRAD